MVVVAAEWRFSERSKEMAGYGKFGNIKGEDKVLGGGAALVGYHGDERSETAHVVIRRAQLNSASNDIGFVRGTDGRFRAILSEYDRSIGYNDQWLGKVHQHYKESQTLAVAKSKGYIFRGKEVIQTANGPQIRLQFVAR